MAEDTDLGAGDDIARARLFFSYTRTEIEPARRVIDLLENAGFEVWWDGLLDGGVNYLATTEAALENADCVVVLWSKASVESAWVRDEAQRGRERGCLVPLSLDGTIAPLGFRQIQLLDISGWNGTPGALEAQRIVAAVRRQACADGAEVATPLPARSVISADEAPPAFGISRRNLAMGGIAVLGGAGLAVSWQAGLLGSQSGDVISMAVLPFANLTGDTEQGWFSDGLSNEVRLALARNPRLQVSAPTSSRAVNADDDFAIGRTLGVRYILRGTVQKAAETVRISVELVEISGGVIAWLEQFDRTFSDILALQSEIAEKVAVSLVSQIVPDREVRQSIEAQQGVGETENVLAYEAYLRGFSFYDLAAGVDSDRAALSQFDAAIKADPEYAAAHAMRATMLAAIANATSEKGEVSDFYTQSIASAERAIALAPNLARGHMALGFALNNGRFDRAGAYVHYKKAEQLAPGDADTLRSIAIFYAYGAQQALGTQIIDKVLGLDPLNARAYLSAGFIALFARDYSVAIDRMREALKLNEEMVSAHYVIATAQLMEGNTAGALASFEAEPVRIFSLVGIAICQQKLGDTAAAQAALEAIMREYGETSLYQQAQIHAQWNKSEQALTLLARAFDEGDPGVLLAPNDPLLDPLRGNPVLDRLLLRLAS